MSVVDPVEWPGGLVVDGVRGQAEVVLGGWWPRVRWRRRCGGWRWPTAVRPVGEYEQCQHDIHVDHDEENGSDGHDG